MKKCVLPLLASLFVVGTAQAANYQLDPTHTKAVFYIDHFNTSTNSGGFYNISGDMSYSPEKNMGSINVKIPTETLNTGLTAFDNHIKSADMLEVEKYPTIEFKSTRWNFADNKPVSIDGILTMKGQSHPVQLKTTKFGCYFSPIFKADVCGGDFETTIDRTKWGVDFLAKEGMAKEVVIKIQAEAIKQ
ncbi:YceI family protein [Providencia vermicola]|uniref:Polyisoprenoid-binding protein n=2 Tax=Providencia TaxID=586 RepID=A0AAI9I0U0_PROST|nr:MULTISPECIES: YceI family protein [Providencia]ELR5036180.1 polyisoprenoid-binding protein [Providencia stuartii]ELR5122622.1 polyisoprenoid-binding protein [Providencia stuartii]ELR5143878.1 polyisoprenoid-binding protein [Providencia stuartii]ELX8380940.1 polyisoprenoid-binding protein [Providencia stuartii]EMD5260478.1 polyisoprenoid-binding protein [Providencia stuartii]